MLIHHAQHDANTGTWTHVFACSETHQCVVIDSVLDYDSVTETTSTDSVDRLINVIESNGWQLQYILETHAHADHLTAAQILKSQLGGQVCAGQGITWVQNHFKDILPLGEDFTDDGSQFDRLLNEGDQLMFGGQTITVRNTPGHTNDGVSYLVGNYVVVGDTIFHPELGSARCDFPGGDAALLHQSIATLLALPEDTQICLCHDYPKGRQPEDLITVARQKRENIHCKDPFDQDTFIAFRTQRDAQLAEPKLIRPSLIHNLRAGLVD